MSTSINFDNDYKDRLSNTAEDEVTTKIREDDVIIQKNDQSYE